MDNKQHICKKGTSFGDCELEILKNAVDEAEKIQGQALVKSPEVQLIVKIVEEFIEKKKLICYGGTAINNILPKDEQFYDYDIELPDYDFFSYNAMEHAIELANIYYKKGYTEVTAQAGKHYGTYKVFVNFIPVADITQIHKDIFNSLKKDAMKRANILYTPPNFLRMLMYLELSRPSGDVSRWEKVLKRLILLNKHYPMHTHNCSLSSFQRKLGNSNLPSKKIFDVTHKVITEHKYIFLGGYANYLYSHYIDKKKQKKLSSHPDFDILSEDPKKAATIIKERLEENDIKNVTIVEKPYIGDQSITLIDTHYIVKVKSDIIAIIYEPMHCHSYNELTLNGEKMRVATIDTMLSFYLAFVFTNRDYFDAERMLCMCSYLFDIQRKNRLSQKGILKRFSISCYGKAHTLEDINKTKGEMFKKLKHDKQSLEYKQWFLRYNPASFFEYNKMNNGKKHDKKSSKKTLKKTTFRKNKNTRRFNSKRKMNKSKRNIFNLFGIM